MNMGAWRYLRAKLGERLFGRFPLRVVSRPESASPATGSASSHKLEQERLLEAAFSDTVPPPRAKRNNSHAHRVKNTRSR